MVDVVGNQKWLIYGAISGGISRTATAPLERLKVLNQVQHMDKSGPRYQGVLPALRKIRAEEGFRAYWKGNGTNVIRIMPSDAARFYSYDTFKKLISTPGEPITPMIRVMAGGLAGMVSTIATYPLDLVRTRLSVQTLPGRGAIYAARYQGMWHCLSSIFREEGFFALYKGMGVSILGVAPYVAINFASYETLKQLVKTDGTETHALEGLVMGGLSGTAAVTLTYPSDVLRRRMMMQGIGGASNMYNGLWDACVKIGREEGVAGFYRGLIPCYLKVVPAAAIGWACIETLQKVERDFLSATN